MMEILVALGVIALIGAIVLVSFTTTRNKSRIAKAQGDLAQLAKALQQMAIDTSKWPNGCPMGQVSNPEVKLETEDAGLALKPQVGVTEAPCAWTALDVSRWSGPYISTGGLIDPWGTSYYFDPDYHGDKGQIFPALVSWGPNKTVNDYDQNNIIFKIK